jgi:hypothetical protein
MILSSYYLINRPSLRSTSSKISIGASVSITFPSSIEKQEQKTANALKIIKQNLENYLETKDTATTYCFYS